MRQESHDERVEDLIANADQAIRAMGHWPSFHDARVKQVQRTDDGCTVVIHVSDMTTEVDARGYYVSTNHHLVTMVMSGIGECTLPPDYRTDVLFTLSTERAGLRVKLVFDSAVGSEFTWHVVCDQVTLAEIMPCSPQGEAGR